MAQYKGIAVDKTNPEDQPSLIHFRPSELEKEEGKKIPLVYEHP